MFGMNSVVGKRFFKDITYDGQPRLFVTSVFYTFQGEGPYRGKPAVFVRLAKCNLACTFCFVAGTMITMGDGSRKPIEEIVEGDNVLSWDGEKFIPGMVAKTMKSEANELVSIRANGQLTTCTPEHPILIKDKGWVEAKDVAVGDTVIHLSVSERMRLFNPMKDPAVSAKVVAAYHANPDRRNILKELWDDPDSGIREKVTDRALNDNPMKDPATAIKGFLARGDLDRRSATESKVENAIIGMGAQFVGNGDLVVANKCPDFVITGQNKLIEVWDDEQTEYYGRDSAWRHAREKAFAAEGWDVMFLPITHKTPDDLIRKKVGEFINNGLVVTEVNHFTNPGNGIGQPGKRWIRYSGKKGAAVNTYNFEVSGTHTYVANNMVVHNCDTYFDDGEYMTFDQIMELATTDIAAKLDSKFKGTTEDLRAFTRLKVGLVVTGGEPLLQDDLGGFLAATRSKFAWQQVETNGTQPAVTIPKNVTLVVSPKCAEKDGVPTKYLSLHPGLSDRVSCLKFVVDHNVESPYHDIPDWAKTMPNTVDIYCSPMNIYAAKPMQAKSLKFEGKTTVTERSRVDEVISFWEPGLLDMAANRKNHEYTAALCVRRGYTFNVQQHLLGGVA